MPPNLVKKFSIYSIIIISFFGILLNLAMAYHIEEMFIEQVKIDTVNEMEFHSKRYLTPDLLNNYNYNKYKDFFNDFYYILKTDEIIRIKIYDKNERIVYSDEESLVGRIFHDNEELKEALNGSVEIEIQRKLEKEENIFERNNYSGLMEIYIPLRSESGEIYGALELYRILDDIDKDIAKSQKTIAIITIFGLLVLYLSLIWIVKDASETIIKQNIALEKSYVELKGVDKMKTHFVQTMSHELRTPLNAIIGFSDILKQQTSGLDEKQYHYIDNIYQSGRHLLALINDILDMIVIDAGKIELVFNKIPVHPIIDDIIQNIKVNAEKNNVIIEKEIDPALEFICADKQRFVQIISNLLDNAVKFSKKDGGLVKLAARKAEDKAIFSISDNGIGIKEKDLEKLFKAFNQLDSGISRRYGGTGLGLSISKSLVELHGGRIWVESKFGEGSIFSFELPLTQKAGGKKND